MLSACAHCLLFLLLGRVVAESPQLRGLARGGTCLEYGCGSKSYDPEQSCQCNDNCMTYGNCCHDYQDTCASCSEYGCGIYVSGQACQCNEHCARHRNCCRDYQDTCVAHQALGSCSADGCGRYDETRGCQCNDLCATYNNCCPDYQDTCIALVPSRAPSSTPTSSLPAAYVLGHPSASKEYPVYEGFTLTLAEEFDAPLDLDTDLVWTWSDGGLIESQVRFVKEAITFESGTMRITASETLKVDTQTCSNAEVAEIEAKNLTSGELRTRHNLFRYGRYEASIKAPSVQPGDPLINGNYIATMFVFRDAKYNNWREIDFEITGDAVDSVTTNVLSADNTDKWSPEIAEVKPFEVGANLREEFHSYAFEWLPDRISWYFDGKLIREKTGGDVPIPDLSGKIMMNLWVFDNRSLFGGPNMENNQYPMQSEYDWFRFYKWNDDAHYPCEGLGTECLTSADKYLSSNNPCDGIPQTGSVYGKAPCVATCKDM